jgi:putative nucleotidyltransferase-like protein
MSAAIPLASQNPREALVAALGGGHLPMDDPAMIDRLVDAAIDNGLAALLAHASSGRGLPPRVAGRLTSYVRGRHMLTALMDEEVARVLDALAADGVRPLVIKGAHLAHTIYPSPALRPRADTDLLVAMDDRERVPAALARIGYERFPHVRGSVILGQFHFTRTADAGVVHALDVHWRIAAPLMFADVLPVETLRSTAEPVPALGPHAFGPSLAHALVLACIHLAAHHRRNAILLWLYDLRLLARVLDDRHQAAFIEAAAASGATALCAKALEDARQYFDDPSLASLTARVAARGAGRSEPSARLLTVVRPVDQLLLDLRAPATWRARLTLLREHLCPDPDYMRVQGAQGWLPLAYARRAVSGARKWLRHDEDMAHDS